MSGLKIQSSNIKSSKFPPNTASPPVQKNSTPLPFEKNYLSKAEQTHKNIQIFFETLLTLFIKIPFIKNFILFIWKLGLKKIQPNSPIYHSDSLLFNSSVEIPKWFDQSMRQESILTLINHLLTELKMISKQPTTNLNHMFTSLSQIDIDLESYQNPFVMAELQKKMKETICQLIQNMQNKRPEEPIQLHLGSFSQASLKKGSLSSLFICSFTKYLNEHGNETPIRILHIYGPCNDSKALSLLLKSLGNCPTLYHLHFNFDEKESATIFKFLDKILSSCPGLEFLVFCNRTKNHRFFVPTENWRHLANAISFHKKLRSLSFYNFPSPPETFRNQLQSDHYKVSHLIHNPHGFCIKSVKRLT